MSTEDKVIVSKIRERYSGFFLNKVTRHSFSTTLNLDFTPATDNFKDDNKVLVDFEGNLLKLSRKDFFLAINTRTREGNGRAAASIYSIDSLLRVVFSWLAVEKKGFFLHCAGVVSGKNAFIFTGKSGSGKSTIAKKFPRKRILSDELVLLKVKKDKIFAYSTPFWGELEKGTGENLEKVIKKVFFLKKSNKLAVKKANLEETIEKLMPNILFFVNSKEISGKILEIITIMSEKIEFNSLLFPKNIKTGQLCI